MRTAITAGPDIFQPASRVALVLLTTLWMRAGFATQLDLSAGYRAETSDNINRVNDPALRESDVINSVTTQMLLTENSNTLVARIAANIAYNHYLRETFENQTVATLDAYGEAYLIERTFSWVVADGFRQLVVDPLDPDTPANRTNSNSWQTGPNLYLRFGPVDTLQLEAYYGRTETDSPGLIYHRNNYVSRWLHRTSPRAVFSLNYEWLYLNYDFIDTTYGYSEPYPDLNRQRLYLRFDYRDAGTIMNANVGATRIEQYGQVAQSIPLFYFSLARQAGSTTTYGMRFRSEYSDIGGEMLPTTPILGASSFISTGIPAPVTDTITLDPFKLKNYELFHARTGVMFPTTLQLYYRDTDYVFQNDDDREETGATASILYAFTPTMSLQLLGTYQRTVHFRQTQTLPSGTEVVRKDRDSHVGTILTYRLTPSLRLGLEAHRYVRNSSWGGVSEYTDDRFGLTLIYQARLLRH